MATSISEKMGGPHVEDSLSPWSRTDSQQQGLPHEPCLIPLQDGPGVSDMWWVWIKSVENC